MRKPIAKKHASTIAKLINDIDVAELMYSKPEIEHVKYIKHRCKWAVAIIRLHAEYGIDLPTLELAEQVRDDYPPVYETQYEMSTYFN